MWARLRSLTRDILRRSRMEQDMTAELRFHLDARIEDLGRQGVQPQEAGRRARLEFGSREAYKELCREARGLHLFDEARQDLRYGFRSLRRNAGFTIVVVLSLALGIGGNTAIFSLLDAVILKSLPIEKPGELSLLREYPEPNAGRFSYPMFQRLQEVRPAEDMLMAMGRIARLNVSIPGNQQPEIVKGQLVSGEYFSTLRVSPALGRLLTAADNRVIDGHPVAVISYRFWRNHFGGASSVLGQEIKLNTAYFTIVGIAHRGFSGVWVDAPVDVWIPLAMQHSVHYAQNYSASGGDAKQPWFPQDGIRWLDIVSRTAPRGHPRLEAALNAAFQQVNAGYAEGISDPRERRIALAHHVLLEPFGRGFSALRADFVAPLLALMALVGLVLFIACANIASLLLARSAARQREIATRLSLGAGRARLIRQLLTESMLLALSGGTAGLLVGHWTNAFLVRMVLSIEPSAVPPAFALDFRVFGFAALLSLITGVLFGLAPAFRVTQTALSSTIKAASRSVRGGSGLQATRPLVVFQVTLSLMLLVSAGLFGRSFRYLSHLDLGFDREHLLAVWIDTRVPGYSPDQLRVLYRRLTERLEAVPGVRSACISMCGLDTDCGSFADGIEITGYQRRSGEQVLLQVNNVGPKYFQTVGMKLVEGREFDAHDRAPAHKVAIINEAMARRYFANRSALGQRFGLKKPDTEIIGVVRDARVTNVADPAVPMVYYPMDQGVTHANNLDVRTIADPRQIRAGVRRAVGEVDPNLPIRRVATLVEQIDDNLTLGRLIVYLTSAFGFFALTLACVGLYGVMSYAVSRRTAELGVRMALGAPRSSVLWMILRESLVLAAFGLAAGVPLVLAGSRLLSGMLFGVSPTDPGTLLVAAGVLVIVAAVAGYLPAFRASRVDPMVALRYE